MVVLSFRWIICRFDKFTWLNTLLSSQELDQQNSTTLVSTFFLNIKLDVIFSFACCLRKEMKLVQLLHITKRILDYAPCQPPKRSFPSNSSQKSHRKISSPVKSSHRGTLSGLQSSFPTFVINYHPPDTRATCQFASEVLHIFISKTYTANFTSFTLNQSTR